MPVQCRLIFLEFQDLKTGFSSAALADSALIFSSSSMSFFFISTSLSSSFLRSFLISSRSSPTCSVSFLFRTFSSSFSFLKICYILRKLGAEFFSRSTSVSFFNSCYFSIFYLNQIMLQSLRHLKWLITMRTCKVLFMIEDYYNKTQKSILEVATLPIFYLKS